MSWVVKYLMNNSVCVLSRDYSVYYILRHMLHCIFRNSRPDVFLVKGVTKICRKLIGEHSCRSVTSICKATLMKLHFGMGVFL